MLITLVLLLGLFLRFWQLGSIPPGLDWDEVSNAYNGYSILKTGQDEFGQFMPILFRAYDAYVPGVLIYLNSLSVFVFGLNNFAARLPNAFLGTLTILGVYLFVREAFKNKGLAILAALFLAISPWHVFYSRINVFATTPVFFVVWSAYFFIKSLENRKWLVGFSVFSALAILSYYSAYIFVPLFTVATFFIFRRKLKLAKRHLILIAIPIVVSGIVLLGLPGGQKRLKGVSAFSDPDLMKNSALYSQEEGLVGRFFHNRRLVYGEKFLEGYFSYFDFKFLFGKSDTVERMVVPGSGFGLLYFWDLPFLAIGTFLLVKEKSAQSRLILVWLLLAPIAGAAALPLSASTRATLMIPAMAIITAYGFLAIWQKYWWAKILLLVLFVNFLLFAHHYFVHFRIEKAPSWFYGYRELFDWLDSSGKDRRVHFIFRQHDSLDQVHMFLAYYNKIDPAAWQENGGTRLGCIGTTGQFSFGRWDFVPLSCLSRPVDFEAYADSDLVVTTRIINDRVKERIDFPSGEPAFYVYEYRDLRPKRP